MAPRKHVTLSLDQKVEMIKSIKNGQNYGNSLCLNFFYYFCKLKCKKYKGGGNNNKNLSYLSR